MAVVNKQVKADMATPSPSTSSAPKKIVHNVNEVKLAAGTEKIIDKNMKATQSDSNGLSSTLRIGCITWNKSKQISLEKTGIDIPNVQKNAKVVQSSSAAATTNGIVKNKKVSTCIEFPNASNVPKKIAKNTKVTQTAAAPADNIRHTKPICKKK